MNAPKHPWVIEFLMYILCEELPVNGVIRLHEYIIFLDSGTDRSTFV